MDGHDGTCVSEFFNQDALQALGSVLALVVLGMVVVAPLHTETVSLRRLLEVTDLGNPVSRPTGGTWLSGPNVHRSSAIRTTLFRTQCKGDPKLAWMR